MEEIISLERLTKDSFKGDAYEPPARRPHGETITSVAANDGAAAAARAPSLSETPSVIPVNGT